MNSYEVDSFKIRIPYELVKIINHSVEGKWIAVNSNTGEIDDYAFRSNSYHLAENGIKVKYAIEKMPIEMGKIDKFATILINSKILKERYLEGITKDNIKIVYDYLIAQKIILFDYDTFLKSSVTDVDFKRDIQRTGVNKLIEGLYAITKEHIKPIAKKHIKKDNKGIEWNDRGKADVSKPFFKIYHKGLELRYHSTEFSETYLSDEIFDSLDNTLRIEYTIKNKRHFKKFEIEDTSLLNILSLPEDLKFEMMKDTVTKNLDIYEVKPVKISNKLCANDKVILQSMYLIIERGIYDSEMLAKVLTREIENKSYRYRKAKELKFLWDNNLKLTMKEKEQKAKINQEIRDLLFV